MLVKVGNPIIQVSAIRATRMTQEAISFKSKGIDGDYTACGGITGGSSCANPGKTSGRGGA